LYMCDTRCTLDVFFSMISSGWNAEKSHNAFINKKPNTVKPVLRGHLWVWIHNCSSTFLWRKYLLLQLPAICDKHICHNDTLNYTQTSPCSHLY
jgi:hypothetical protein